MASKKVDHSQVQTHLLMRKAGSSLAVAAATTFIALSALLSFVPEPQDTGRALALRGTLAPSDTAAVPLPADLKRA